MSREALPLRLEALVFDAYGTLFDVHSVRRRCEALFPGRHEELSRLWRAKQLEYTWLRSLMRRYAPFSTVTREALAHACQALGLELTAERMEALMAEYTMLDTYSEVPRALSSLRSVRTAILSNGSPDMLEPPVAHSGLHLAAVFRPDPLKISTPPPAGRQPAAVDRRRLRHDPLPEPPHGRRHAAGVRGTAAAVPPGDRAALRLLDAAGRVHGERGDRGRRRGPRDARGGRSAHRARRAVLADLGALRQPGASFLPRAPARPRLQGRRGVARSRPVRRSGDPVEGNRLPHRGGDAQALVRRPRPRRLRLPRRGYPRALRTETVGRKKTWSVPVFGFGFLVRVAGREESNEENAGAVRSRGPRSPRFRS